MTNNLQAFINDTNKAFHLTRGMGEKGKKRVQDAIILTRRNRRTSSFKVEKVTGPVDTFFQRKILDASRKDIEVFHPLLWKWAVGCIDESQYKEGMKTFSIKH